jgi:hypothetical protein
MGGHDFLNDVVRYCLWLRNASPQELRRMPIVLDRLVKVRDARLKSPTPSVRQFASTPALFTQDRQPSSDYLAIPEVSSIRRSYIPIGFICSEVIASNKLQIIREPSRYIFGMLCSSMHNIWMKTVGGRLKSDYSYSPAVYNNFPWPDATDAQKAKLGELAQGILDARANHPGSTLADLYDPLTMPPDLRQAHDAVDRFVDRLYRKAPFETDADRVALLFKRYQELTATPSTT